MMKKVCIECGKNFDEGEILQIGKDTCAMRDFGICEQCLQAKIAKLGE